LIEVRKKKIKEKSLRRFDLKGEIRMGEQRISRRWIAVSVVLCVVLVALAIHRAAAASGAPEAGTMAPDFTLPSQSGADVSLHDFRGKWVVLYFYPKDLSHGCTIEARNFQQDQEEFRGKNAVIIGISVDSTASHEKFCSKEGLNFKLLSDADHKVSKQYGSLDNLGVVRFSSRHTFLISPDGHIAQVFLDVNPSKHSAEVLAALTQLKGR
jgi:thioredoxin-dependent peroxiredoxin